MDLVGSELGRPAGELSEYSLNGSLDAAVRASSAQYDSPDILDRLRLRLHRQLASDTGALWPMEWSCIIPAPPLRSAWGALGKSKHSHDGRLTAYVLY